MSVFKLEIENASGSMLNITEYIVSDSLDSFTQRAESDSIWSIWLDNLTVSCGINALARLGIEKSSIQDLKKKRAILYYYGIKVLNGFVNNVNYDIKEEEIEIEIVSTGYLFAKAIIVNFEYIFNSITTRVDKLSTSNYIKGDLINKILEVIKTRAYLNLRLGENKNYLISPYFTLDIENDVDFIEYKGYELNHATSSTSNFNKNFQGFWECTSDDSGNRTGGIFAYVTAYPKEHDSDGFYRVNKNGININDKYYIHNIEPSDHIDFYWSINHEQFDKIKLDIPDTIKNLIENYLKLNPDFDNTKLEYTDICYVGTSTYVRYKYNNAIWICGIFSLAEDRFHYHFEDSITAGEIIKDLLKLSDKMFWIDVDNVIHIKSRAVGRGEIPGISGNDIIDFSYETMDYKDVDLNLPDDFLITELTKEELENYNEGILSGNFNRYKPVILRSAFTRAEIEDGLVLKTMPILKTKHGEFDCGIVKAATFKEDLIEFETEKRL